MDYILVIDAPHYYAAVISRNGKIIDAAPVLNWAVGKKLYDINRYCERKGYQTFYSPLPHS